MTYTSRVNPRFNRTFGVTLHLPGYQIKGQARQPSAYGASIEVPEGAFHHLSQNPALWENRPLTVMTPLNTLPAQISSLYQQSGKSFFSLRLLENRNWYK